MRLEFLHRLIRVIYQRKSRAFTTAILCPEAENGDLVFVGFVELGEFVAEFVFGDVGAVGVKNVTELKSVSKALFEEERDGEF